jgi:shikimate kinase
MTKDERRWTKDQSNLSLVIRPSPLLRNKQLAQPQNIILVGFMASGKSHVGRVLSRKTGWPLVDADDEIVHRAGKPIHQLFQEQGEAAFRTLESTIITDLCAGSGRIIAAGGGAFVSLDNRRRMLDSGLVFCLSARPETVYRRVAESSTSDAAVRPLLAGDNPLERIKTLLAKRSQAYAQAHHTIETDTLTPEQVADCILRLCHLEVLSD